MGPLPRLVHVLSENTLARVTSATRLGGLARGARAGGLRVLRRRRGAGRSCSCTGSAARPRTGSRSRRPAARSHRVLGARPARPRRVRRAARRCQDVGWFADAVAASLDEARRARARSSSGTRSAGSSRCVWRCDDRIWSAGLLLVAPAGIRTGTRVVQVVDRGVDVRPARGGAAARSRRLLAARAGSGVPSSSRGSSPTPTRSPSDATLGFLDGPQEHANTAIAGRAMVRRRPAPGAGSVCAALRSCSGALRDTQLPLDDAFEYARRLGAPLRVVADCGHLVIGERPGAVLDGVRRPRRTRARRRSARRGASPSAWTPRRSVAWCPAGDQRDAELARRVEVRLLGLACDERVVALVRGRDQVVAGAAGRDRDALDPLRPASRARAAHARPPPRRARRGSSRPTGSRSRPPRPTPPNGASRLRRRAAPRAARCCRAPDARRAPGGRRRGSGRRAKSASSRPRSRLSTTSGSLRQKSPWWTSTSCAPAAAARSNSSRDAETPLTIFATSAAPTTCRPGGANSGQFAHLEQLVRVPDDLVPARHGGRYSMTASGCGAAW